MKQNLYFCAQCYQEMNYAGNTYLEKFIDICEFYHSTGQPYIENEADPNVQYVLNHLENIKHAIVSTEMPGEHDMILIYPRGTSQQGFCFGKH